MRLVVDASIALHLVTAAAPLGALAGHDLAAPGLLWSEVLSALRERTYRGHLAPANARAALGRMEALRIARHDNPELRRRSLDVAEALGWAKTYDAEYVALAELLDGVLLTVDGRLRRGAERRVRSIGPTEL